MTGDCCVAGRASQPLTRRLSKATASILPAAWLVFLPKCPLCLAGWLSVATGISFSANGAAWLRGSVVLLCIGALTTMLWRRLSGSRLAFVRRRH